MPKHTPPASARPIPGFDGYLVDNTGTVWSVGTNWRGYGSRPLIPTYDSYGYLKVRLLLGGRRIKRSVHGLVALVFLGPRPSQRHEVRHLDGNKERNCSSNLAWGTQKENADDRERHGRTSRGAKHGSAVRAGLPPVAKNKGVSLSIEHRHAIGDAMRGTPWSEKRRAALKKAGCL